MFSLSGLKLLVKSNIRSFEEKISIFNLLDIVKEVYQKLSDDEIWFTDYLTKKFKIVFNTDETLFSRQCFLNHFEKIKNLDKAMMKSLVKIYTDKIASTANFECLLCISSFFCFMNELKAVTHRLSCRLLTKSMMRSVTDALSVLSVLCLLMST